jgi:hypothetical protein
MRTHSCRPIAIAGLVLLSLVGPASARGTPWGKGGSQLTWLGRSLTLNWRTRFGAKSSSIKTTREERTYAKDRFTRRLDELRKYTEVFCTGSNCAETINRLKMDAEILGVKVDDQLIAETVQAGLQHRMKLLEGDASRGSYEVARDHTEMIEKFGKDLGVSVPHGEISNLMLVALKGAVPLSWKYASDAAEKGSLRSVELHARRIRAYSKELGLTVDEGKLKALFKRARRVAQMAQAEPTPTTQTSSPSSSGSIWDHVTHEQKSYNVFSDPFNAANPMSPLNMANPLSVLNPLHW